MREEIINCDRCRDHIDNSTKAILIDVTEIGAFSGVTNQKIDLCKKCSKAFFSIFMSNK